MARVKLSNIDKSYGAQQVIHDVTLEIADGEFTVFVGPSGCGKSTLLRSIAGLEAISRGTIMIGGEDVTDKAPSERNVAMVFQSYALYPHMTVRENMEFGMKINNFPVDERNRRITEAARILQLDDYLDRKPAQLSGGQRQRVAIGRAIVKNPAVFLFDEPLSNLDAKLRVQMRVELEALHRQLRATMIYVTHDQVEAMTMADRIVVLNGGRIEQVGSPMELYHHPRTEFVAGFIGAPAMNFLDLDVRLRARIPESMTSAARVGIRPEHIVLAAPSSGDFDASVRLKETLGGDAYLYLTLAEGSSLTVRTDGDTPISAGETVGLMLPQHRMHIFDSQGIVLRHDGGGH
ncbi:MAG: ABC transporter ATP-binding protein [Hyphomicrobiales bacterium]